MNLTLNGNPHTVTSPLTVDALLAQLGLGGKPVVVELNQRVLFPREFSATALHEGDRIEIVQITAGG
ncbi:MAG: sulfur carrier protein ThiS [Roseimicrobium sp.]